MIDRTPFGSLEGEDGGRVFLPGSPLKRRRENHRPNAEGLAAASAKVVPELYPRNLCTRRAAFVKFLPAVPQEIKCDVVKPDVGATVRLGQLLADGTSTHIKKAIAPTLAFIRIFRPP